MHVMDPGPGRNPSGPGRRRHRPHPRPSCARWWAASSPPGTIGRPRKHGGVFTLADPDSWHIPDQTTTTDTTRYGTAVAMAWERMHPRLSHRGSWLEHEGELPIVEGTLVRLQVERLPGEGDPKPVWSWSSTTEVDAEYVDRLWQAFLRRFDLEHTFRVFKQTLVGPARRSARPRRPIGGRGR